jgi:peptidoglycan/LPS O-acetylase OafA/YrhL
MAHSAYHDAPSYRPDIDGLRAIAVLSVFLYHLGIPGFRGGFVGVDVFFVISGYLITRLLLTEYDTTGKIDYRAFYLRRIRRILPVLTAVLFVTSIAAILLLSPTQVVAYGQSLIATVASGANIWFAGQSGYFDGDATLKPLLHTWSLGVEEQFYLIWPLCVAALARLPRWRSIFVAAIIVVATIFCAYWLTFDPTVAFFYMPFRIGEFAVGALVVVLPPFTAHKRWVAPLLYGTGMVAIAAVVTRYTDTTVFPGFNALVPCLATGLCIWTAPAAGALTRLLSNRLMVQIGLLSYVIYLVHWPVIVFSPYLRAFRAATWWDVAGMIFVTLVVSILLHWLVERPWRNPTIPVRRLALGIGTGSFLLAMLGWSMWAGAGWEWRQWVVRGNLSTDAIATGKNDRFQVNAIMCARRALDCSPPTDGKPRIIIENPVPPENSFLIIGDSHAVDALNALYAVFPEDQFYLSQLGACPPLRNIEERVGKNFANLTQCKTLTEKRFDLTYLRQFDAIAINVLYVRYEVADLRAYLQFLHDGGIRKVIVFGDFVTLSRDLSEIATLNGFSPTAIEQFRDKRPVLDPHLRAMTEEFGYFYISKYSVFCPDGVCAWIDAQQIPFTYDKSHLSFPYASRLLLPYRDALRDFLQR